MWTIGKSSMLHPLSTSTKNNSIAVATLWLSLGVLCVGEGLCFLFDQEKITDQVHNMIGDNTYQRLLVWAGAGFAAWHFLVEGELKRRQVR